MKFILLSILIACAIGYARGGRLHNLVESRLRASWLIVVGLAMQVAPIPNSIEKVAVPLLLVSFVFLLWFAVLNIRAAGFVLIVVGIVLNFTVIAANRGMPVSRSALVSSGQLSTLKALRDGGVKHHLAGPGDVLLPLADEISLGDVVGQVVSVGDLFTYGGVMLFVSGSMAFGRKRRRDPPLPMAGGGAA